MSNMSQHWEARIGRARASHEVPFAVAHTGRGADVLVRRAGVGTIDIALAKESAWRERAIRLGELRDLSVSRQLLAPELHGWQRKNFQIWEILV